MDKLSQLPVWVRQLLLVVVEVLVERFRKEFSMDKLAGHLLDELAKRNVSEITVLESSEIQTASSNVAAGHGAEDDLWKEFQKDWPKLASHNGAQKEV